MSDVESLASNMSDMSVAYTGVEMTCEEFVDQAFKEIQQAVNNIHSATREILMMADRNESWSEIKKTMDDIEKNAKEGISVFKEIVKTNKQIVKPLKPKATQKPAGPGAMQG